LSKSLELLLATKNPHKLEEIKNILGKAAGITYLSLHYFPGFAIKETGRSLLQNSLLKAEFAFKVSGKPSLADDSGLFIDALDGEPGIFSSRYASTDQARIEKVLKMMRLKIKRTAQFRAVFVYYFAPQQYQAFEGICPGTIAIEPRGAHGFGYDPIFIPDGYKKTFAEMTPKTKNRISHRARALRKFKAYLLR
jgi:XTP/dITP diphosphohydrolase